MLLALAALAALPVQQPTLLPRRPLAPEPVVARPLPEGAATRGHRLVVKFADTLRVRATATGELSSAAPLAAARDLARGEGLAFRALLATDPARIASLEARAAARSGVAQPDLLGMLVVEPAAGRDSASELERIGRRLQALPSVEWVSLDALGTPPPGDLPPTSSSFEHLQDYFGPAALDVDPVHAAGITGDGVRLSDCEYGWEHDHEDLNDLDLHPEPGQTPHPDIASLGWDEHGTAVVGSTSAVHNAYGCKGLVPGAEVHTFPEWTLEGGFRRETAIASAIAGSAPGDVVLLEMQASGAGGGYGPAELSLPVWTLCKAGSDAGVVIVGAAGNGSQDLDSAPYVPYMNRGDSGAILVGAGHPTTHAALGFSTYGSRVNLQGWGQSVTTLGYGGLAVFGGDDLQDYTSSFSGTSSASPMVASAAVLVQSLARSGGAPLDPLALRQLLVDTGTPQSGTRHIGPLPDVAAAVAQVDACGLGTSYCSSSVNSTGAAAELAACGSTSVAAADLVLELRGLPAGQPGLVYYGSAQTLLPFGDGFRCVAGSTGRLAIGFADAGGTLSHALDYATPPSQSTAIQPGSTWNFQGWYRDPAAGASGFNLSQGRSLTFLP